MGCYAEICIDMLCDALPCITRLGYDSARCATHCSALLCFAFILTAPHTLHLTALLRIARNSSTCSLLAPGDESRWLRSINAAPTSSHHGVIPALVYSLLCCISCLALLCSALLRLASLCCAMLCLAMLCHAVLACALLC